MDKIDIKSLNLQELTIEIGRIGEASFRAKQIYEWLHKKGAENFDHMTNLSVGLREKLNDIYEIISLEEVKIITSKLDGTSKFLFKLKNGDIIESVLMKYRHGNSVCISSQVGCRMGCRFCASTILGLERNLSPSEMLDQVYKIQKISDERISNVVVMGVGEPLDNYDNLLKFIELLTDENGLNISQRGITVSTCGIIPKINELANEKLQITLAISLHAPNDEIRKSLMPIANTYNISKLLKVCINYFEQTGRRLTFEYALIEGINDSEENANELIDLVKCLNCHINLIPINPVTERNYKSSNSKKIIFFKNLLEKNKINVTIRREMGQDIEAACGQLRKSYHKKEEVI